MNGTLTIFHTTIANSEMLESSRYSVTNNYLTNFETCLMPLDISLDDIEPYTVYRVNRIGRGCIAYRIIHQVEHVRSEKVDIRIRKKLFNVLIKALSRLKIFLNFHSMFALNLFSYLELCLIKTTRELSFNLIDTASFRRDRRVGISIRVPEINQLFPKANGNDSVTEARKSGRRVGRKIRPSPFSRFTRHPVYRPRERFSRGTLVEDIPTSSSRGSERGESFYAAPPSYPPETL